MSIEQINRELSDVGLDPDNVAAVVRAALAEDLAGGIDVTTAATVPVDQRSQLRLTSRQFGVVAGLPVAALVFELVAQQHGNAVYGEQELADGLEVHPGTTVMTVRGATQDLLTGERTALNLLCHLSGVATATREWVRALSGSHTKVRDTRKTLPLLRALQKYAVRCGGGVNHRMALSDAALVKDNHVVSAGGVAEAFELVRARFPGLPIEVEVDSLEQLSEVLTAGADLVLLDNFSIDDMRRAVDINRGRALLEASGGLRLEDAAEVGATGVDFVAVGALTHSAQVLDIGADLSAD